MSDKNMDDLLAQLKTEFEPKPRTKSKSSAASSSQSPPPRGASPSSVEQSLAQLRQELESGRGRLNNQQKTASASQLQQSAKEAAKARQQLNALIDQDYQKQAEIREAKIVEAKRQAEARIAAEKRRQQELLEIQQREELRARRRKEALREDAKQWLEKLDPKTEEAKWFREFSYSYENKLQAAIDYLEAMREIGM